MPKSGPATRIVAPSATGWLRMNSGSARQAANKPSAKPTRLTRLRYSAGMIWSVSTLLRRSGSARPVWVVKGSMVAQFLLPRSEVSGGGQPASHRGGRGHLRGHQVGACALALAAFEVPVRGGGAALTRAHRVRVHAQAHGAARRPPLRA